MARKPDSLATYAILESYVKMIAQKCSQTYSKKIDTIKKIEFGDEIPTGSTSTTKVMCLICTYDDGTVINIDATPLVAGMSDVVTTADLQTALADYTTTVDLNNLFSGYTTTVDLENDFLKKVDAYLPTNQSTLNLLTQDTSGNLLFNGHAVASSSGGATTDWDNVTNKPFSTIDSNTLTVNNGELTVTGGITLDASLSDTSTNGVQNKAIADEFKKYTTTTNLNTILGYYAKPSDITTVLANYTDTATLNTDYAKKTDLHTHTNKTVLDNLSDDAGSLKYGSDILLTKATVDGLISKVDADNKYIAKSSIESDPLDLSTL